MKSRVVLRKSGKFYYTYDNNAFVLHAITNYKISNGRVGFPINTLGKVETLLEEKKINYTVIIKDEEVEKKDFKNRNNYNKYLEYGKENNQRIKREEELIELIKKLPKEKTNEIIKYLTGMIYE